jgi:uncharacterized protein
MSINMYKASVPVFQHMLRSLLHILHKAELHTAAHRIEPSVLTSFRLFPDMIPFNRQVHIACDAASKDVARISGVEAPSFDDNDASLPELKARVSRTLDYLATVPASAMDGTEDKEIKFMVRGVERTMRAEAFLTTWTLANFFFHITMAYAILRHNGVNLGKLDYLDGALVPPTVT